MKQVLVTGGAGFIGSHLCEALLLRGYGVRVLDNLVYGSRENVPAGARFIEGDITSFADCEKAMDGVSAVFHCAAMSRSAPSEALMHLCGEVNILGTQNVLMAARDAGVEKIIYSGSSTFYGNQPAPHREEMSGDFLNIYALSKYVGEQYCLHFDARHNLAAVILRYFNVYGPRQPQSGAYALVLGIFLEQLKRGEALEIHGDGLQRRDFVHVLDVVRANIAALEKPVRHAVINIGSGTSTSVQELADRISTRQVFGPRRRGDAMETLADITRARRLLDWEPSVRLTEGLREMMPQVPA